MSKKREVDSKQFVVKSNSLVEARYRLSLQESHVILWLLMQIKPEDEDFKTHRLDIVEYANMVGLNAKGQYQELENITERLMKRVLKIREETKKKKTLLQVSWLSSAKYFHGEGYTELCFDPKLKPYLLQLKSQFTKINIADTMKFKSIYAIRIFELLLQYEAIGNRIVSIDELREWCGIEKEEYVEYKNLKLRVLTPACREINEKTQYEIDYKEIKESRKVKGIDWSIKHKTHFEKRQREKAVIIEKELRSNLAILEQLLEYGFTKQAGNRLIKKHELDDITNAINAVDQQLKKGNVKNPKAMLLSAIKNHWLP